MEDYPERKHSPAEMITEIFALGLEIEAKKELGLDATDSLSLGLERLIVQKPHEAIDIITAFVKHENPKLRKCAVTWVAMGTKKDPEKSISLWGGLLGDKEESIREAALNSLKDFTYEFEHEESTLQKETGFTFQNLTDLKALYFLSPHENDLDDTSRQLLQEAKDRVKPIGYNPAPQSGSLGATGLRGCTQ